eukprot:161766-Prymnesium_polylepis.2
MRPPQLSTRVVATTAHYCPLPPTTAHYFPLPPSAAHCCPLPRWEWALLLIVTIEVGSSGQQYWAHAARLQTYGLMRFNKDVSP